MTLREPRAPSSTDVVSVAVSTPGYYRRMSSHHTEESELPRVVPIGRFSPDLDLAPFVEVVLDRVASIIDGLAGGRYTEKDRAYAIWAFHILEQAGYALAPEEAELWFRRDGRIRVGAEHVAALVGASPTARERPNPYKPNIVATWEGIAERSVAAAKNR
jgi:hypothetical protein